MKAVVSAYYHACLLKKVIVVMSIHLHAQLLPCMTTTVHNYCHARPMPNAFEAALDGLSCMKLNEFVLLHVRARHVFSHNALATLWPFVCRRPFSCLSAPGDLSVAYDPSTALRPSGCLRPFGYSRKFATIQLLLSELPMRMSKNH
ncbi:hypothetical protein AMTR_s00138p00103060 [Amborella trichopoda]|uniref:Uncharacterized protein n=1 Tax=Amborella trichopoda TaxID=13333 RepID=W1NEM6_AMBTC|nr:hypothetical protein AMTR_s00138p00103060 [Amborella trichopoda]